MPGSASLCPLSLSHCWAQCGAQSSVLSVPSPGQREGRGPATQAGPATHVGVIHWYMARPYHRNHQPWPLQIDQSVLRELESGMRWYIESLLWSVSTVWYIGVLLSSSLNVSLTFLIFSVATLQSYFIVHVKNFTAHVLTRPLDTGLWLSGSKDSPHSHTKW